MYGNHEAQFFVGSILNGCDGIVKVVCLFTKVVD
jgi:hypothetical protein